MISLDFWKNKKVFITGNTGFKGSWLSQWLLHLGAEIKGFALEPEKLSLFNILELSECYETVAADIRNQDALFKAVSQFKPDIIIHMAAQPLVRSSYSEPVKTLETNILGTIYINEIARKINNLSCILNVTTDKVYENDESGKQYEENDKLGGFDPYSASKACSELISSTFNNSFFLNSQVSSCVARSGNVIGGGDFSEDRIIPDLHRAVENNSILTIRNPNSVRPWQHVLDPLSGYLLLIEKQFEGDKELASPFNFGPLDNSCISVQDLINEMVNCSNLKLEIDYLTQSDNELHESNLLSLDCSKARKLLRWSPKLSIQETAKLTIDWYNSFRENLDMKEFTIKQIKNYQREIA